MCLEIAILASTDRDDTIITSPILATIFLQYGAQMLSAVGPIRISNYLFGIAYAAAGAYAILVKFKRHGANGRVEAVRAPSHVALLGSIYGKSKFCRLQPRFDFLFRFVRLVHWLAGRPFAIYTNFAHRNTCIQASFFGKWICQFKKVKDVGCGNGACASCCDAYRKVIVYTHASASDYRYGCDLRYATNQLDIITLRSSITVDRIKEDLACAQFLGTFCPLNRIEPSGMLATLGVYLIIAVVFFFRVYAYHDALCSKLP